MLEVLKLLGPTGVFERELVGHVQRAEKRKRRRGRSKRCGMEQIQNAIIE